MCWECNSFADGHQCVAYSERCKNRDICIWNCVPYTIFNTPDIHTEEDSATAISEVKFEGNVLKIISKEVADPPEFLVDPVEVILFDDSGGIYHNPLHGITLRIPDGAIPAGMNLEISIGILLHGNFEFPEDLSPVSAIVWLCIPQPDFTFSKQVEIIIPHFMECRSSEDAADLQMQFMKASHKGSSTAVLNFKPVDGMQEFATVAHKGLLRTRHLCYLCISKSIARRHLQRRELCISCAEPTPQIAITSAFFFYITYFIETCIQVSDELICTSFVYIIQKQLLLRNYLLQCYYWRSLGEVTMQVLVTA